MVKMKKLCALLLSLMLIISHTAQAAMILEYNGERHNYTGSVYKLMVNGKIVATPLEPIIFNDRALVPVREVFEAMGATVGYINDTREVTVSMGSSFIMLQINSPTAFVNGTKKTIPDGLTPMLIAKAGEDAKTMVPARFVSESVGMNVVFDGTNGIIKINNPAQSFEEETPEPTKKPFTSTITSVGAEPDGEMTTVTIKFDKKPEKIGELVMLESGVLYTDVAGATYTVSNKKDVNVGAVKSIRLGQHDEYTRIAIDTAGADSYYKKLSTDGKKLTISVAGEGVAVSPVPTSEPTPTTAPTPTPTAKPTPTPEAHLTGERIVVIDAGHGGSDSGAVATHDEVKYTEKKINLDVAKKVRDILKANGVRVEMTRSGDTYPTLVERSDFANELGAAMFISIHSNASADHPEANGIEVYYSKTNNGTRYGVTSKDLAADVLKNMIKNTSANNRGVKTEQHVVTRTSEMPAILIELGFITNAAEAQNLYSDAYQDLLAGAIAAAVLKNIDNVKIPPTAE